MSGAEALRLDRVSFAYGRHVVLDGVSIHVGAGEFVALAGPNGSGKSSLVRVALGLNAPSAGAVRLFGEPPAELRQRWRVRGRRGARPRPPPGSGSAVSWLGGPSKTTRPPPQEDEAVEVLGHRTQLGGRTATAGAGSSHPLHGDWLVEHQQLGVAYEGSTPSPRPASVTPWSRARAMNARCCWPPLSSATPAGPYCARPG